MQDRHRDEHAHLVAQREVEKYARNHGYRVNLDALTAFTHPVTGIEYRLFAERRTAYLPFFFDEERQEWRELPVAWEALIPQVTRHCRLVACTLHLDPMLPPPAP